MRGPALAGQEPIDLEPLCVVMVMAVIGSSLSPQPEEAVILSWRSHSGSPETWFGSLVPALCSVPSRGRGLCSFLSLDEWAVKCPLCQTP